MRHASTVHPLLCVALITLLVITAPLQAVQAAPRYGLRTAGAAQRLPDHQGTLGIALRADHFATLPNGRDIVAPTVVEIQSGSAFEYAPIAIGDQLYAINSVYFSTLKDMVRYVRSLTPGSTAQIEYFAAAQGMAPFVTTVVVGQRTDGATSPPPTPPAQDTEPATNPWLWLGVAVGVGVLVCALTGCVSGESEGPTDTTDPQGSWFFRERRERVREEPVRPDTSIGCAWGDRAYGTCH